LQKAREAQKSGASREQVQAILDTVKANVERLRVAQDALTKAIDAVLTAEQRASNCFRRLPVPIFGGFRHHR
jgi:hypothetical protein